MSFLVERNSLVFIPQIELIDSHCSRRLFECSSDRKQKLSMSSVDSVFVSYM